MGMSMGMIGAIGGAGNAFIKEGDHLYKEEERNSEVNRQKGFQDWLMKRRQEFQVEDEARAEARDIRKEGRTDARNEQQKDRDFDRTQREAPARRGIKSEDTKAETRAKSDAAAETADQDAGTKRKLTEAGQTEAQRNLQNAQADYYRERGDTSSKVGDKLSGADSEETRSLREAIKDKRKMIDQGRVDGTWNDAELTPGQKKLQAELVALEKRQRAVLEGARESKGGGAAAAPKADPLGLRKPAPGGAAPGARQSAAPAPGDADRENILRSEHRRASQRAATATDPDERRRAELDRDSVAMEMQRLGFKPEGAGPAATPVAAGGMIGAPLAAAKVPPAAAPAPAAAAPAAPAAPAGTPKGALDNLLGAAKGGDAAPAAAGPAGGGQGAAPDYRSKVDALKAKASGGGAAPAGGGDQLMQALGASGGGAIDKIVGERAEPLRAAAEKVRAAQAQVVSAAKSQNPAQTAQATQAVSAALSEVEALLKNMNPQQAKAVKNALGLM